MSRLALVLLALLALPTRAAELELDGEIIALETAAISPPSVDELWQLTLTELAADGAVVKQGDVVATFEGGEVQKKLDEKQSALKEKQTQRERLKLELAERERNEAVATAEQRAKLDKAARKATQPPELLRRVDYQKLAIERRQAQLQMALAERRETLAAEQRRQEWRLVEAEVAQLTAEVARLERDLASLRVVAPREGVVLHLTNWQGEKFDVGSQVWRGQSVAQIPDLGKLAARVAIPERDFTRVALGAAARVSIEGGAGQVIPGRVSDIGRGVHSKSKAQPVPVVDAIVVFDAAGVKLKPGQPVRVRVAGAAP